MIRFENVGMRYGAGPEVLHDVTFDMPDGAFRFLTGPSGAGKSSLLKLMYLFHRPSRGLVNIFERDIATIPRRDLPALRRRIGVVFQDCRLIGHMTAYENVALPLRITGRPEADIRNDVTELLTWVGLKDHLNARPATLSGGQQQRVAIARAVISRPSLLLADEPTGNVDDEIGMRLLYRLEALNRQGTTVVVATHNQTMLRRFDYPVMHLEDGVLYPGGPPGGAGVAGERAARRSRSAAP